MEFLIVDRLHYQNIFTAELESATYNSSDASYYYLYWEISGKTYVTFTDYIPNNRRIALDPSTLLVGEQYTLTLTATDRISVN